MDYFLERRLTDVPGVLGVQFGTVWDYFSVCFINGSRALGIYHSGGFHHLVFYVVSLCEIHKLLDKIPMPDVFSIAYVVTFSKHILLLPNICQNFSLI